MSTTRYLIIGNGAAGCSAAETIRSHDATGAITIVSAEPYPMYSRPGLAYVLINEIPLRQVVARSREWYDELNLQLIHGRAVGLNTASQLVTLADGRLLHYDRLLIATGARAVPAGYPGADLSGTVYLDTYEGTKALLKQARRGKRAVVIGGGITALELAEGLAHQGVLTHYFLRGERIWSKVFNQAESDILAKQISHHGVKLHMRTEVAEVLGNWRKRVRAVRTTEGEELRCHLFGVAIGVRPQLDLVKGSPLALDRAILVNEMMQSNQPNVYAAGDCAQVYDRWSDRYLLDILWPSAVAEGKAAALNMVGLPTPYRKGLPFNACLLFGLHITIIGQIMPEPDPSEPTDTVQHLSRGSSEVWFTFPRTYQSAWSRRGDHTLRLVVSANRLVGALVVGEQTLSDPLRHLIENEVDASPLLPYLHSDRETLQREIMGLYRRHVNRIDDAGARAGQ